MALFFCLYFQPFEVFNLFQCMWSLVQFAQYLCSFLVFNSFWIWGCIYIRVFCQVVISFLHFDESIGLSFHSLSLTPYSFLPLSFPLGLLAALFAGVYGDVQRVKILFNKKDSALIQMADMNQAQLGKTAYWKHP